MIFLGLDIGTSGCKAAVFDSQGQLLATASREYVVRNSQPGWAELDSQEVGDKCLDVIREAAGQCLHDRVVAMAISSQGEAFTALDANGHILSDAMVSSDNRAIDLVGPWVQAFGVQELYERTGHTAHPIFTLFKLIWLRQNRPEVWRKATRYLCFEDYLQFRLGIEPAISWSLAGRTMLFNVRESSWDSKILNLIGLRPEQLSRPAASGSIIGTMPAAVTDALNLAPGAVIVAGGHDQVCAALGAGAISSGQAALATGSVECVTIAFPKITLDATLCESNLCTYAHAAPGLNATLAYNLTGGNLLKWYREELGRHEREQAPLLGRDVYDLILEGMSPKPTTLLALPYFTGSGTPYFDAHTPGALLGLRLDTTRGDILRALLEGLAFELKVNFSLLEQAHIPVQEIFAVGGGARNQTWLQLKADVLNRPIRVPKVTETGCLGCALLSCSAVTGNSVPALISEWVKIALVVEPEPGHAAYYQDRFHAYQQAYRSLRQLALDIF